MSWWVFAVQTVQISRLLAVVSKKTEAMHTHENCIYGLPSFLTEYKEKIFQLIYYTLNHAAI